MKTATLAGAVLSGRRFKSAKHYALPNSHRVTTGHAWRVPAKWRGAVPANYYGVVRCAECGSEYLVPNGQADEWILEMNDDELESESKNILRGLGYRLRVMVDA